MVLANTYEYSPPSNSEILSAAAKAEAESTSVALGGDEAQDRILVDMRSRFLGLVVLPGKHVVRIQEEVFASQMKGEEET